MKDIEFFMVYNTITEQYYGPCRSAEERNDTLWLWMDNVDDIIPWTIKQLEHLCKISYPIEELVGIKVKNIIIVPMGLDGLDFINSISLIKWFD